MNLRNSFIHLFQTGLLAAFLIISTVASALEQVADVRTVIDVSGSMKKNDPHNLRAPALRLLVGLMPDGTQSGVWTFGQYVNMNVKQGKVDGKWKKLAMGEAEKIHSRGLYTNIEEAVRQASFGWNHAEPRFSRHLILLTDGVVDIAKDSKRNQASRRRIIEELLPRLKQTQVKVHSVALSKDADHELLKTMSGLTGGWYQRVDNAEHLQKVFLRLFEKSAPVDSLPINANKFQVDEHVKDMTLVLFHSKKGQSAKVISPDKTVITKDKHSNQVRWHQEQGYELITIKRPQIGEWALQTEQDPDNRVMVVTNLRLKVNPLPNSLLLGDKLTVKANLTEDGKTITRQDFLKLVDFKLLHNPEAGDVHTVDMLDDGNKPDILKQDGVYSGHLAKRLVDGQHMVAIKAVGPTFKREFRHLIKVISSPADLKISRDKNDDYKLVLTPHLEILQPATISAQVKLPDEKVLTFTQESEKDWSLVVPGNYQEQIAILTLIGTRMDDKPLELQITRILAETLDGQAIPLSETIEVPVKQPEAQQVEKKTPAKVVERKDQEEQTAGFSWSFVLIMIVLVNLLLVAGAFAAYKTWKKRSSRQQVEDENDMEL
jgi:uncharacterized protein (TIGR03503 family)